MDDADEGRQPPLPARADSFETAAAPLPQDKREERGPHVAPAAQERSSPRAGAGAGGGDGGGCDGHSPHPAPAASFDTGSRQSSIPAQDERENGGRWDEFAVSPNKHRLVQVRRAGSRKLFDRKRRKTFLNWFAATCNARLSAAKAGVAYQTVFKHRMKDEGFAAGWDRALAQGYARIEARSVEEVERMGMGVAVALQPACGGSGEHSPHPAHTPLSGHTPHPAQPGAESPSPGTGEGQEGVFDVQLALQLLREHSRRLSAGSRQGSSGRDQRTTARAAGNEEIAAALVKRLRAFALRQGPSTLRRRSGEPSLGTGSGQALRQGPHTPHPAHPEAESPSPLEGEGQK